MVTPPPLTAYRAPWWLPGGNAQTLWAALWRPAARRSPPRVGSA
jgi:hypothetical protein